MCIDARRLRATLSLIAAFSASPAYAVIVGSASAGVDINGDPYPADTIAAHVVANTQTSPFGGIGDIAGGTGALLDSTHVLTAAHLFRDHTGTDYSNIHFNLNAGDTSNGQHTSSIPVQNVAIYPGYAGLVAANKNDAGDIAVVTLQYAAPANVPTYPLYTSAALVQGQVLQYVGYGQTGYGDDPTSYLNDNTFTKRFGYNQVEYYLKSDGTVSATDAPDSHVFIFGFDPPSGSPGELGFTTLGNQYESNFGNGDSGSPCFPYVNGHFVYSIAAIAGFNLPSDSDPYGPGTAFGNGGGGQVVRPYATFINGVLSGSGGVVSSPEPSPILVFALGGLGIALRLAARRRSDARPVQK